MKKITLTIISVLFAIAILAQAPQGISHQAVIRNVANQLVANAPIGIQVSVIQGSSDGTVVYTETHLPTSNANGLISFVIGQGTVVNGIFDQISWANGPYFIKTQADPTGGTNYTIEGISQMLSVPYALFAEKVAGSVASNVYPPTVVAIEATNIESFSATMNSIVNAEGFSSTVDFEWGTTTAYGNTITAIQSPVTGSAEVIVNANLSNLQSFSTYHYRIRATNAVNVSYSNDMEFSTLASAPQLTTNIITNILAFSATSGGNITYDGGMPVSARGIVWSTNPNPTLDNNFTVGGEGTGSFTSEMTGLIHATTYYVRAYATNAVGTTFGNQRSFTTQSGIISLSTHVITDVTANSALTGGNITNDGSASVTARGVAWSLNPGPTLANHYTEDGSGMGSFTSAITGLTEGFHYYVRAYATNGAGTYYGNERIFFAFDCGSLLTDVDGNIYNTVLIGNQCWMKENLETTKYRNNTSIEYPGSNNTAWQTNNTGAYAWYNNDISWKDSYGALYNWHAVNNSNSLCPTGWHVPTDAEFTVLTDYLGGTSVAGGKMKSARTFPDPHPRWESPNAGATNESNWSGLPGGYRDPNGTFNHVGSYGYWWSTTVHASPNNAWYRYLNFNDGIVNRNYGGMAIGFSIRCLRD